MCINTSLFLQSWGCEMRESTSSCLQHGAGGTHQSNRMLCKRSQRKALWGRLQAICKCEHLVLLFQYLIFMGLVSQLMHPIQPRFEVYPQEKEICEQMQFFQESPAQLTSNTTSSKKLSMIILSKAAFCWLQSLFIHFSVSPSCHLLLCKNQKQNKLQQTTKTHLFVCVVAIHCPLLEGKLHEDRELTSCSSSCPALPLPCIQRKQEYNFDLNLKPSSHHSQWEKNVSVSESTSLPPFDSR